MHGEEGVELEMKFHTFLGVSFHFMKFRGAFVFSLEFHFFFVHSTTVTSCNFVMKPSRSSSSNNQHKTRTFFVGRLVFEHSWDNFRHSFAASVNILFFMRGSHRVFESRRKKKMICRNHNIQTTIFIWSQYLKKEKEKTAFWMICRFYQN